VRAFSEGATTRAWGKLRPVRNRGFRARLRHNPRAPAVVSSPHLDDAVIDCWSVLTGPGEVRVVNVFAGVPASRSTGYFDRLAGATDAVCHVRRRIAEDRTAPALGSPGGASPLCTPARAHVVRLADARRAFEHVRRFSVEQFVAASEAFLQEAIGALGRTRWRAC
jgi:hypothetical protein